MSKVKTGIIWLGSITLFILGLALAFNTFSYFNFDAHYGFLRLKETAIATGMVFACLLFARNSLPGLFY